MKTVPNVTRPEHITCNVTKLNSQKLKLILNHGRRLMFQKASLTLANPKANKLAPSDDSASFLPSIKCIIVVGILPLPYLRKAQRHVGVSDFLLSPNGRSSNRVRGLQINLNPRGSSSGRAERPRPSPGQQPPPTPAKRATHRHRRPAVVRRTRKKNNLGISDNLFRGPL